MSDKRTSVFADMPANLPALLLALTIQERCASVGFDWDNLEDVLAKVREELDEVQAELQPTQAPVNAARVEEEIGDLLFAVVNLCRHAKVNPDTALCKANQKFIRRFQFIESQVDAAHGRLQDYSLDELEALWQQAKQS